METVVLKTRYAHAHITHAVVLGGVLLLVAVIVTARSAGLRVTNPTRWSRLAIHFRTCMNDAQVPEPRQWEFGYGFWIGDAFAGLGIMTIALFGLTYVVLKSQTPGGFAVIRSGA